MEGAGFFQSATCFVSQEHIQIIKIISDIDQETQQQINEQRVKELISLQLETVKELVDHLHTLSRDQCSIKYKPKHLAAFESRWYCTHSQSLQLKELLRRWDKQMNEDPLQFCSNEKKLSDVIYKLIQKLDNHANSLY